jgi:hypothetical protein
MARFIENKMMRGNGYSIDHVLHQKFLFVFAKFYEMYTYVVSLSNIDLYFVTRNNICNQHHKGTVMILW